MEKALGHVLVVEDEYLIAVDLAEALERHGATILGPFSSVAHATAAIDNASKLDGAVIDINLGGELSFPIAALLRQKRIPFIFTSGYDRVVIPPSLSQVPLVSKPADSREIAALLLSLLGKGHQELQ
ncbi:DNA-binding response OmpR family regulator [Rhizobium sp. BK650]|uniref:response regulator n=1 Tax=Rhizobium sp. BK650 TaxID=2586990 RepID=UPI00161C82C9|nr:response regulator [Rhizobium sp. BK650]MBB3655610.1 DNA-binding response OmpR family regulator [Rhizobium sp. BK650]